MCRFVGTVPDILGLVWPSFRPKSGSKSKIPGRILKCFRGLFSSAERACPWPGPSEVVDDHVLKIHPAGPDEVKCHGLAFRRLAGGRPEVVNDHIFKKTHLLLNPGIENPSVLQSVGSFSF